MTYEQAIILKQLVDKYKEKQINVCIEEMSELTKALCKHNRGKTDIENIKEEIADVHIMLMQMLMFFEIDEDEFLKIVDYKINRTKERLLNE
jgi:NTP pyrophosphatase (non-canonical NTP hydrolase)